MNIAIIVAAGSGTRFSPDEPKQFSQLVGKPLITHTLEKFEVCPSVHRIALVLSEAGRQEFGRACADQKFTKLDTLASGGATRAESVRNGLAAVNAADDDVIAVHDGARPLVTPEEIAQVIESAIASGAACLVAPLTDTIKSVEHGVIHSTIDRDRLRRAMTPQAFRYEILRRAFDGAPLGEDVTDECCLVERLGIPITAVEGSPRNIKITRPEDLRFAEAILCA